MNFPEINQLMGIFWFLTFLNSVTFSSNSVKATLLLLQHPSCEESYNRSPSIRDMHTKEHYEQRQ